MYLYNSWYNVFMDTLSSSELRADLAKALTRVTENQEPLLVTRQGAEPVVVLSLEHYCSLEETAYLLRSPENARRLAAAINSLESGGGKARRLAK